MDTGWLAADSPWRWWSGFPVAFVLTCVTEVPAYLATFVALGWCRRGRFTGRLGVRSCVALALAVNLVSHPVLWSVARRLSTGWSLLTAEIAVAVVEGLLIFLVVRRLTVPDLTSHRLLWALFAAAVVNAWSVLVGVLVLPVVMRGG